MWPPFALMALSVGDVVMVNNKIGRVQVFSNGRVGVSVNGRSLWRTAQECQSVFGHGPPKQRADLGDWVRLKNGTAEGQICGIEGGRFRVKLLDGSSLWRAFADLQLPAENAPVTPLDVSFVDGVAPSAQVAAARSRPPPPSVPWNVPKPAASSLQPVASAPAAETTTPRSARRGLGRRSLGPAAEAPSAAAVPQPTGPAMARGGAAGLAPQAQAQPLAPPPQPKPAPEQPKAVTRLAEHFLPPVAPLPPPASHMKPVNPPATLAAAQLKELASVSVFSNARGDVTAANPVEADAIDNTISSSATATSEEEPPRPPPVQVPLSAEKLTPAAPGGRHDASSAVPVKAAAAGMGRDGGRAAGGRAGMAEGPGMAKGPGIHSIGDVCHALVLALNRIAVGDARETREEVWMLREEVTALRSEVASLRMEMQMERNVITMHDLVS